MTLRIPLNAKVSDACTSEGWRLASPRSDQALSLQIYLSTIHLPSDTNENDHIDWYVDDKLCQGFSSSKTWEILRPRDAEKDWAPLVWFKGSTPKHAFHLWVTNLNRLPTRSRLASWGLQISTDCCLCVGSVETRDHLFLHCPFAQVLWSSGFAKLRLPPIVFADWSGLMAWAKGSTTATPSTLRLLLIHAIVYAIWRQRNNLIHNQNTVPPLNIFKEIDRLIINSITARRKMKNFRKLMALWLN
ncbi:Reverse transcriptase zinc-binding domain [Arabidopsis suecica]|uniref:Reverse transcriptase zinc-binding domain n=1 Tax=Arabidopsis suecica TaxID=45249 RepID=A0A8T2BHM0_ARASU|nr:Reverse transcriptase zinc-binding domain [Arabidopsis suecica]